MCVVDDYSRLAWAELVEDITSLTVMFATPKCLNMLHDQYGIKFEEVITDNGPLGLVPGKANKSMVIHLKECSSNWALSIDIPNLTDHKPTAK